MFFAVIEWCNKSIEHTFTHTIFTQQELFFSFFVIKCFYCALIKCFYLLHMYGLRPCAQLISVSQKCDSMGNRSGDCDYPCKLFHPQLSRWWPVTPFWSMVWVILLEERNPFLKNSWYTIFAPIEGKPNSRVSCPNFFLQFIQSSKWL